MRIKIIKPLPWLWEKGQEFRSPGDMRLAFEALHMRVIEGVTTLEEPGRAVMYGATTAAIRKACFNQRQKTASYEWRRRWERLGLLDRDTIGIPADCCEVLQDK